MLIEDSAVFLGILVAFFEQASSGVTVAGTARSGEEGLRLAQQLHPDGVTVDLRLPGISGIDVIAKLRQLLPRAAIVALTQYDEEAYRAAAFDAGADAYVPKEALRRVLLPALRSAAERRCASVTAVSKNAREGP